MEKFNVMETIDSSCYKCKTFQILVVMKLNVSLSLIILSTWINSTMVEIMPLKVIGGIAYGDWPQPKFKLIVRIPL